MHAQSSENSWLHKSCNHILVDSHEFFKRYYAKTSPESFSAQRCKKSKHFQIPKLLLSPNGPAIFLISEYSLSCSVFFKICWIVFIQVQLPRLDMMRPSGNSIRPYMLHFPIINRCISKYSNNSEPNRPISNSTNWVGISVRHIVSEWPILWPIE